MQSIVRKKLLTKKPQLRGEDPLFSGVLPHPVPPRLQRARNPALRLVRRPTGRLTSPREYLVGPSVGKYSIADIGGAWSWVKGPRFPGIAEDEMDKYPNLLAWLERICRRPAVKSDVGKVCIRKCETA